MGEDEKGGMHAMLHCVMVFDAAGSFSVIFPRSPHRFTLSATRCIRVPCKSFHFVPPVSFQTQTLFAWLSVSQTSKRRIMDQRRANFKGKTHFSAQEVSFLPSSTRWPPIFRAVIGGFEARKTLLT